MVRYAIVVIALLAGCTADHTLPKADAPSARFTETTSPTLIIRANTFGPNGEIWMESGAKALSGTRLVWVNDRYVEWRDYSGPSALSTGGSGSFYNGGDVQVFAVAANGSEIWLGNVTADMSQDGHTLNVPAGTSLRLRAYTNPNCSFNYYRTAAGNIRTNPAVVSGGNVVAYFWCNEDYGSMP